MTAPELGPASQAGRRAGRRQRPTERPYPLCPDGAAQVALAATRALLRTSTADDVAAVVRTAVADLGGACVPARLEPDDVLGVDVSLGLSEPVLVVADPLSVATLELRAVLPQLVEDARLALHRLPASAPMAAGTRNAEPEALGRYVDALAAGDGNATAAVVRRLLLSGVRAESVAEHVLAPAQREVGERWYAGRWSVADEHAATSLTEAAAASLPLPTTGPVVVFAAPAEEWHTLPGRLAAVAAGGVRAVVLGPGVPAEHLGRYLEEARPAALALSCTIATSLIAAADTIAAAHEVGVPVVAGGRAFGTDDARALALGADAWAASAGGLADLVQGLRQRPDAGQVPQQARLADAVPDALLLMALERQAEGSDWIRRMNPWQQRHSVADLRWIARHAAAAHACRDPRLLDELLQWLDRLLRARGVPAVVLPDGSRYLADALEAETPDVAELLLAAVDRLVASRD
jgi:methanogenic corrinoid protein MtbC1